MTIRAESTLVQAEVVVRGSDGGAVPGLERKHFRVFEDGKERQIEGFSAVTHAVTTTAESRGPTAEGSTVQRAAPEEPKAPVRFIALFFDDFGTPSEDLVRVKRAAKRFVQDGMSADSRAAIFAASGVGAAEFTGEKPKLIAAIDRIEAHPKFSPNGLSACPRITPYDAYLIANRLGNQALQAKILEAKTCGVPSAKPVAAMIDISASEIDPNIALVTSQAEQTWDQVRAASQSTLDAISRAIDALAAAPGDRLLLLVSSGFLAGTLEREQDRLTEKAVRERVTVSGLDAKGLFVENPGRAFGEDPVSQFAPPQVALWEEMSKVDSKEAASRAMAEMAEATGGLFFHRNNDYSLGFRELGAVPEAAYLVAFRPGGEPDGKYHKLRFQVTTPGPHSIQARPGYFADARAGSSSVEDNRRAELDREAAGADVVQGFPAAVAIQYGPTLPSGSTTVRVQAHVDVRGLQFPEHNGRRIQKLTVVAVLFDAAGNIVSGREGGLDLALGQAKYQSMLETGVSMAMSLAAPQGAYRLRAVAMEGVEGKLAALTYAIRVP